MSSRTRSRRRNQKPFSSRKNLRKRALIAIEAEFSPTAMYEHEDGDFEFDIVGQRYLLSFSERDAEFLTLVLPCFYRVTPPVPMPAVLQACCLATRNAPYAKVFPVGVDQTSVTAAVELRRQAHRLHELDWHRYLACLNAARQYFLEALAETGFSSALWSSDPDADELRLTH